MLLPRIYCQLLRFELSSNLTEKVWQCWRSASSTAATFLEADTEDHNIIHIGESKKLEGGKYSINECLHNGGALIIAVRGDESGELGVTLCGECNLMEGCVEVYDHEMTCAMERGEDSVDAWCRPELLDGYCIQRSVVHH